MVVRILLRLCFYRAVDLLWFGFYGVIVCYEVFGFCCWVGVYAGI